MGPTKRGGGFRMIGFPRRQRPAHLGPYPYETLARDAELIGVEAQRAPRNRLAPRSASGKPLARAAAAYQRIFAPLRAPQAVPHRAPVPDDLARRAVDIKGGGYFLDAAAVGICAMPANGWLADAENPAHGYAIAVLVEYGRFPEADNLAATWLEGIETEVVTTRAAEIAAILAGYIAHLGYAARAHWPGETDVDLDRLGVLAGLVVRDGELPLSPFVDRRYVLSVVTTDYELATDLPLAQRPGRVKGLGYLLGTSGAVSGLERQRRARRASHLGIYPLETVRRVKTPTTLIFDDEIPRLPQRALFYNRAEYGDLGDKMIRERWRWAYKHPFAQGILPVLRAMVPHQDGEVASAVAPGTTDAAANTRAIKSLSYYLGAAMTGVCRIPRYAWYSHRKDGSRTPCSHSYAVCMLIDQGEDTGQGASGDDWISGSQSMRAYMRGGEIAGLMAMCLRSLGHPARPQTNVDSDVIHNPLLLLAGLAEQSRIGETTLNPFIGPRFKSVILTTDLPLVADDPIDFGLQYFCGHCYKCARECPCDAIPFKDKVIWNGYETWKPDSERCTRYRFTNMKGSACGRCIKVCPLNKNTTLDGGLAIQLGSWLGINARWLKTLLVPAAVWLDDRLGHGRANAAKKWWLDLEVVDGASITPRAGTNFKGIDIEVDIPGKQRRERIAYYPANVLPPPDDTRPFPIDRKAALAIGEHLETPTDAVARRARGESRPEHYRYPWDDGS
jgi:ferredoxin